MLNKIQTVSIECKPNVKIEGLPEMYIHNNRYLNKGKQFTIAERTHYGILSCYPFAIETLEDQLKRAYDQFSRFELPINKYQFLCHLNAINTTLFYALILSHTEEMLPIIYTPTVGEVCLKYGDIYSRDGLGFYLSSRDKGHFEEYLNDTTYNQVEIIVITDGSRILGLGDLGSNGVGISVGKCSLYVVGAGFMPRRALPVLLDMGTNTESVRNSIHYMGQHIPRVDDKTFYECLDEFMEAASKKWSTCVIQFEDFSNNHCFDMLTRYQNKYRCFNDDIQGTGAVVSAGFISAIKISGLEPLKQKVVVLGAGSAAVGVVNCIAQFVAKLYGCSVEEMRERFYLIDTKGLVTVTRGDKLADHKIPFARKNIDAESSKTLVSLLDVMMFVKPTAFLGLGGVGRVLTKEMIEIMMQSSKHPIIFPLSNPTSKAEIDPKDAYEWTNGAAIVASGSPFGSTIINGKVCTPSQGNNMYIFPGLGFGAFLAQPPYISNEVILTSAMCLQKLTSQEDLDRGHLYPPLASIREISAHIASAVIDECQQNGLAKKDIPTDPALRLAYVKSKMWKAEYAPEGKLNPI